MRVSDDALGALELLKSETFKKAFAQVESDIMSDWKNTTVNEDEKREKLWMQLTALEAVRAKLQSMISNAKLREI